MFDVLSQKAFQEDDLVPPAWWASDADFPKTKGLKGRLHSLEPPAPDLREEIIADLRRRAIFADVKERVEEMVQRYEHYTEITGDDYFLVRSFCNVGTVLLRTVVDARSGASQFAQRLARLTLRYQPYNPIAWGLWRDALFSGGDYDAAVSLGWETVLRFPDDPLMRNELAEILIALDQVDDAHILLEAALEVQAYDAVTYAILARILASKGDVAAARDALSQGLAIDTANAILTQWLRNMDEGKPLPLVAKARQKKVAAVAVGDCDDTLAELERSGKLRRLRQHLKDDDVALEELKSILNGDPTFAYAQILAARHRIWHASDQGLPPVAVAFEDALANEDIERLSALTERMPRLESLVLLARAILGDAVAADEITERLRHPRIKDNIQVIEILQRRFKPVFQLIDGGLAPADAIAKCAGQLRLAVYDTNEAVSAPILMVA